MVSDQDIENIVKVINVIPRINKEPCKETLIFSYHFEYDEFLRKNDLVDKEEFLREKKKEERLAKRKEELKERASTKIDEDMLSIEESEGDELS